ncbi:MAG: hypothetical protein FJ137_21205 [Deltaproteobacteria bacterium]|nr:hypothetical protein [Deltaproteobacteria bacterium]
MPPTMYGQRRRCPLLAGAALAALAALATPGCSHGREPAPSVVIELHALDASFVAFTSARLTDLEAVEQAVARLEAIRLDWLDVVGRADGPRASRDRLLALLRLAELHLDLAARVRRVPYPVGTDDAGRGAFDAELSRIALPLEATGQGMLAQALARAARDGVDGRFVRRARLYQRLHGGRPIDDDDVRALHDELAATTFRAPATLLQVDRVGQRASR